MKHTRGQGWETKLRDQQSFQQAILDSLTAEIALLDRSGHIAHVNNAWKRAAREHGCFCIAHAEPGMDYLALCRNGEAGGSTVLDGIRSVLDGSRESYSREFACHSSNDQHWFLLSVTPLAGRRGGVVLSRTDITEQKGADAARAQLAAIVESSTSAITAATLDGTITSWNKGAERLYGYTAAEVVGRSVRLIVPRNRRHEFRDAGARLQMGEAVETFETFRRHKDGRRIPVALTLSPIKDAQGAIFGVSGIARDISERRVLEAEVLRVNEREQRRIAQDLHDGLAQQMGGIACMAKVLREQLQRENAPDAAMATKIVTLLNDAALQTRNLARGLYPVPPGQTGLMSALRALAERTKELFQIDCTFNCPRRVLLRNEAVANHLYRIAQEAVSNAVRHGSPKHVEIALSSTGARLALGVRDDGRGIHRSKCAGNGIGLRMMHYRANLISGTLVVQHASGGGTEIFCTVDRQRHATRGQISKA